MRIKNFHYYLWSSSFFNINTFLFYLLPFFVYLSVALSSQFSRLSLLICAPHFYSLIFSVLFSTPFHQNSLAQRMLLLLHFFNSPLPYVSFYPHRHPRQGVGERDYLNSPYAFSSLSNTPTLIFTIIVSQEIATSLKIHSNLLQLIEYLVFPWLFNYIPFHTKATNLCHL